MSINLDRVSDAQTVAEKLTGLPKEALLYIAGYAEGCRDKPTRKRRQLLSERSEKSAEDRDLYQLTNAMVSLSALLLSFG